jgi:hypothetical protein
MTPLIKSFLDQFIDSYKNKPQVAEQDLVDFCWEWDLGYSDVIFYYVSKELPNIIERA